MSHVSKITLSTYMDLIFGTLKQIPTYFLHFSLSPNDPIQSKYDFH